MPGPISDSYDPEWGTVANRAQIRDDLGEMYDKLTKLLGNKKPIYILNLVDMDLPKKTSARFTEKEWRLLRFALERAMESL